MADTSFEYIKNRFWLENGFTKEGGLYQVFVNATGAPSKKGTIVNVSPTITNGVSIAPASSTLAVGIIAEDNIPHGSLVKVVVYGRAYVLMKNATAANVGYWGFCSSVAGRMTQQSSPATGSSRYTQVGVILENKPAGTDVLVMTQVIFM